MVTPTRDAVEQIAPPDASGAYPPANNSYPANNAYPANNSYPTNGAAPGPAYPPAAGTQPSDAGNYPSVGRRTTRRVRETRPRAPANYSSGDPGCTPGAGNYYSTPGGGSTLQPANSALPPANGSSTPWYRPRTWWFRRLWRNHRLHHFRNERHWYGVTMLAADRVLGTAGDERSVPLSATARTLSAP